jgi:hypothetical protein
MQLFKLAWELVGTCSTRNFTLARRLSSAASLSRDAVGGVLQDRHDLLASYSAPGDEEE